MKKFIRVNNITRIDYRKSEFIETLQQQLHQYAFVKDFKMNLCINFMKLNKRKYLQPHKFKIK